MKKAKDYRHPCPLCGCTPNDPTLTITEVATMGGVASAKSMTKKQRTERARKAAIARWSAKR